MDIFNHLNSILFPTAEEREAFKDFHPQITAEKLDTVQLSGRIYNSELDKSSNFIEVYVTYDPNTDEVTEIQAVVSVNPSNNFAATCIDRALNEAGVLDDICDKINWKKEYSKFINKTVQP